jgi:hypothetical protein
VVYIAALLVVAGVALYVAAPLVGERQSPSQSTGGAGSATRALNLKLDRATHEQALAVQALRELEFDREMNKLSAEDYRVLYDSLETRALGAMTEMERLRAELRAEVARTREATRPVMRPIQPVERRVRRVAYCPQCGKRIRTEANFCVECGASLSPLKSLAMQAE